MSCARISEASITSRSAAVRPEFRQHLLTGGSISLVSILELSLFDLTVCPRRASLCPPLEECGENERFATNYGKSEVHRTDGTTGIGVRMANPVRRTTTPEATGRVDEAGPRLSNPGEHLWAIRVEAKGPHPGFSTDANHRRFKTGTKIIREWKGQLHKVAVTTEGYLYNGEAYKSLSPIAFRITGTKWSGPAFFGTEPKESTR
jgi:Protein of unknown function (DUF2924)